MTTPEPDSPLQEHIIRYFEDGSAVIRLLTASALREAIDSVGAFTRDEDTGDKIPSVDDEDFDRFRKKDEDLRFYVLRNAEGKGKVLIHVARLDEGPWEVLQYYGAGRNDRPALDDLPKLQEFESESEFVPGPESGLILQHGRYYDILNLPENFTVEGSLCLPVTDSPVILPRGLKIKGHLVMRNIEAGIILPEGLDIGESLTLINCPHVELPDRLRVGGNLSLSRCANIETLPGGLSLGGNLNIESCDSFRALPRLRVPGNLRIFQCHKTAEIAEGVKAGGDVMLFGCKALKKLPWMNLGGNLGVHYCDALEALPESLVVPGEFELAACPLVTALPDGLHIEKSAALRKCEGLREIGGLYVGRRFAIMGCPGLTTISEAARLPQGVFLDNHFRTAAEARALIANPAKLTPSPQQPRLF